MYTSKNSQSWGTVSVKSFRERLRLRLPRQVFEGKQKYSALGLVDTKINRKIAEAKAHEIESDIVLERFDYTVYWSDRTNNTLQMAIAISARRFHMRFMKFVKFMC